MTIALEVAEEFAHRPTLRSVASAALRDGLRELYPTLTIDPEVATLAHSAKTLSDCLLDHFAEQSTVKWRPEQTTLLSRSDAATPLPVDIIQVGALVDRIALGLFEYFKQALVDYWHSCAVGGAGCRNRWAWLAERVWQQITDGLNATPSRPADAHARLVLHDIIRFPLKLDRQLALVRAPMPRVCIVQLKAGKQTGNGVLLLPALVVFSGERVLMCGISGRCEFWPSLRTWEQSLENLLAVDSLVHDLEWTAYEPEDDIFDVLTQTLLESQLADIQQIKNEHFYQLDYLEQALAAVTDVSGWFQAEEELASPSQVSIDHLPPWLIGASQVDRTAYGRLLTALAVVQRQADGRFFTDDLPPILEFSATALTEEIDKDHPQDMDFSVGHVQVRIDKVVAEAVPGGGQPFAVGSVEPVYMTLAEFALENLAGLPAGNISLQRTDSGDLPDWMTAGYLQQLVARADIGQVYPDLLKRYLVTDMAQAQRRERLFADQLRVQLPLLALELKIKGQLSLAGWQTVEAVMKPRVAERTVGARPIVLRPLAFVSAPGRSADVVANMFVIGPADSVSGPHVLYRPLSRTPLAEFSDGAALLAAIAQPGALQNSVLTWLSDIARPIYANGGFVEPHIVRFGLGSEFAPLDRPRPAALATDWVSEDIFNTLFNANAQALITLADRSAISNAENRWMMLKEGGWLLLSTLLPLFGGTVANALWLGQLLASVNQLFATPATVDTRVRSAMLADLLMNISLLLLHHSLALRGAARWRFPAATHLLAEPAHAAPVAVHQASPRASAVLADAQTLLDFSWSRPVNRLTERQNRQLERFKYWPHPHLGQKLTHGPYSGLYAYKDEWLGWVSTDLFRVVVDEEGVVVVRPNDPSTKGPHLAQDADHWRFDLGLRLRGGGPKKTLRKLAEENAANVARITEQVALLDTRKTALFGRVAGYYEQLRTAKGEVRPLFFDRSESELTELVDVVQQRLELSRQLRPGDRLPERDEAAEIKRLASHVVCLEIILVEENLHVIRDSIGLQLSQAKSVVVASNVDVYIDMFKKLLANQARGLHWSQVRESLWSRLRAVPKVGEQFWRNEVLEFQRVKLFTSQEWRTQRMMSLLELCFSKADILEVDELRMLKALRVDKDLHGAFISQAELDKPNDYSVQEQIEVLESALREYDRALDIAAYVESAGLAVEQGDYFEQFFRDFTMLRESTETRLTALIHDQLESAAVVITQVPRVPQPDKRIVRTRDHRAFVGRLREGGNDSPEPVVDVTNPLTDEVITSWHQHADGDWVEIETIPPAQLPPTPKPVLLAPGELKKQAQILLDSVEGSIATARQQSTRAYEPEDVEDILVFKAQKLTALAEQMAHSASDARTPAPISSQLTQTASDLRTAAARLTSEGRNLRVAMIKVQPPTAARVSYLHRQNEVNIARFDGRKNMSGSKRDDFIQEYSLRDRDNHLLWWAHFHYGAEDADAQSFTAAHLKLPDQRLLGYKALVRAAKDNREVVNIYRSTISKEVAQRLFLVLTR
ncbi:hypothetical protein AFK24_17835 [Pseudomonas syringae]|uniref:Dermonecrotic toxin N-terminal domain-containing protein n=1 Tax=Pseudomonas syringae TaxID=317 RepID=A0A1C7Z3D3_PSESX|nr:DUF6543 domain-containing protein [Pseudomonas syringae]OCR23670.1 hypothetical protein AFK24_17835 [Pseudomonas syringae]